MHKVEDIILDEKGNEKVVGYELSLGEKNLLIIKAKKGYVACGYIDKNMSEKLGDVAVFVKGVSSIDDMLVAEIVDMTSNAEAAGLKKGQIVKEVLKKLI